MRRLPRQYGDMLDINICPRCGKIHNQSGENHNCEHRAKNAPESRSAHHEDYPREQHHEQPQHDERRPPHRDSLQQNEQRYTPRHDSPPHKEQRPQRRDHSPRYDEKLAHYGYSQHDESRRAPQRDEMRAHHDNCRCPQCGHAFVWPPEPCPRCGRLHENRKPWVSPGASTFTPEILSKPAGGGFSRLFGENSMLGALVMLSLFGGGMSGISEVRQLFMHPMFQLLDLMNGMKGGGNLLDILGPLLGGQDAGALADILAGLRAN